MTAAPATRLATLSDEGAFQVLADARRVEAGGRHVVHLEIGEPDAATPPHVVEAGVRALRDGETRYAPPAGLPELRAACAAWLGERGVTTDAERVVVTSGGKPALFFTLLALVEPGADVLVPDPGFPAFPSVVRFAGGRPLGYAPADGAAGIATRVTSRTRVLILNSPHNPTGGVLAPNELAGVAELACRHGFWVVSDEVYSRLIYGALHASIAALPDLAERTVVVESFSKTYAMSGWRLGFAVAPRALAERLSCLVVNGASCAPPFVQRAGLAALTGPQDHLAETVARLEQRRDRLVDGLNGIPGVRCARPGGAFYAFPDVRTVLARSTLSTEQLAARLLADHGVAVLPGTAFGPRGAGHLRLSFATSPVHLEVALERIRECVSGLAVAA